MLARWLLFIVYLFQFLHFPPAAAAEGEHSGEFLVISDVHFNSFVNKKLFLALAAQPVSEWDRIFESSLTDDPGYLYAILFRQLAAGV
jgi:hypothetical protein